MSLVYPWALRGLAVNLLAATLIGAPAAMAQANAGASDQAQADPWEADVLDAFMRCRTWLETGAADEAPFEDWSAVVPFPEGDAAMSLEEIVGRFRDLRHVIRGNDAPVIGEYGVYSSPNSPMHVLLHRYENNAVCAGGGRASSAEGINIWSVSEASAGRVRLYEGDNGEQRTALCLGAPGSFEYVLLETYPLQIPFRFATGPAYAPPEGVC